MPVTPTPKPRSERSTPYSLSLTYRPTPSPSDRDASFHAVQSTSTRSLSSSSSDSGDDSGESEYAPAPPSPSPTPKTKTSGDALPRSSGKSRVDEDEDVKPDIKKRVTGKKVSRGSGIGSSGSSGSPSKGSAYAPQEDWELFQLLRPKTPQVNWAEVARKVGRDAKSCQNRWALLNKKLEGAIKGIGA
ncbi:hypothetical protein EHS25_001529 [Saitozyma podzolica]|uniref:Myb-like domain-containing protein n=1 Tax=Saitozyma podzolica TaxID=1890683 RepID=A0A427YG96_9TREE|nr:hypothetical protein EHS25_001529 [Saitozyma podzolica]